MAGLIDNSWNADGTTGNGASGNERMAQAEYHQRRTAKAFEAQLKYNSFVQKQIKNTARRDWLVLSLERLYLSL